MTGPSDYLVHKWLSDLEEIWVGLNYEDPDVGGAYASEITGGGYVRHRVAMRAPSNRATWNISPISFFSLSPALVTHASAWDAATNGNYLFSAKLPTPLRAIAGGRIDLPAEVLAFSFGS